MVVLLVDNVGEGGFSSSLFTRTAGPVGGRNAAGPLGGDLARTGDLSLFIIVFEGFPPRKGSWVGGDRSRDIGGDRARVACCTAAKRLG